MQSLHRTDGDSEIWTCEPSSCVDLPGGLLCRVEDGSRAHPSTCYNRNRTQPKHYDFLNTDPYMGSSLNEGSLGAVLQA